MSLKKMLMGESRKDRFKSVPKKIKDGAAPWHFSFMDDRKKSGEKLPIFIIGSKRIELDTKTSCQGEIQREGDVFYLSYLRGGVKLNAETEKTIREGFKRAGLAAIQLQFTDQAAVEEDHHQRIPEELRAVPPALKEARSLIGNWDRWKKEFGVELIKDDKDRKLGGWLQRLSETNCADIDENTAAKVKPAIMHFRERVLLIKADRKAKAAGAAPASAGAGAAAAPTDPDYQDTGAAPADSDYQDTGVPPRPQPPTDPDYQG